MSVFKYLPNSILHFSLCQGTPIYREDNTLVGRIQDFFVDYEEHYPQVLGLLFIRNKQSFYFHWNDVKDFSYSRVVIFQNTELRKGQTYPKINQHKNSNILNYHKNDDTIDFPPIGKVILDHQIVDTNGRKVVRVNDINFIKVGKLLRVTHAEIGLRSMIRRLGFEKPIDFMVKTFSPKSLYLTQSASISWRFVHVIPERNLSQHVKINLSNEEIKKLHPADLADILEDLNQYGREQIFQSLDAEQKALTLNEIDEELHSNLISSSSPEEVAEIIENMSTDDAADFLSEIDDEKADQIIEQIQDKEIQEEINDLLEYEDDSAGGLMTTEILEVNESFSKEMILDKISKEDEYLGTVYDIFVIDDKGRLIGVCPLRDLLTQKFNTISEIMEKENLVSLNPQANWKEVATTMSKYNLINVPIIESDGMLVGVVSVDDVLPWVLDE